MYFSYQSGDGSARDETGVLKYAGTPGEAMGGESNCIMTIKSCTKNLFTRYNDCMLFVVTPNIFLNQNISLAINNCARFLSQYVT